MPAKFSCSRIALADTIDAIGGFVPTSTQKEALRTFHVNATTDNRIVVTAFDTEMWGRVTIQDANVTKPGSLLLIAADFKRWIKAATAETVEVDEKATEIVCRCGRAVANLGLLNVDEFPEPAAMESGGVFTVNGPELSDAISMALLAVDKKSVEVKFALNSLLFDVADGKLAIVSTDGKKLSISEMPIAGKVDPVVEMLPPAFSRLLMASAGREDAISVSITKQGATFTGDRHEFGTRLIAGRPLPWRKFVEAHDKSRSEKISVPVADMLIGVQQSSAIGQGDDLGFFRLDFDIDGEEANLSCHGKTETVVGLPGNSIAMKFSASATILSEFLGTAKRIGLPVTLEEGATGLSKSVLFRCGPSWRYVVIGIAN